VNGAPHAGASFPDDEAHRVRLASHSAAPPEALASLAHDPSVTVRAAVALNRAAPPHIDRALAADDDERVRALLAGKVASLLLGLGAPEREQAREQALATLAALVEDEAERVRGAIAAVVATMAEVPHQLIVRLAHDISVSVAEPVILLSPLLTAEDLLALIGAPPTAATLLAVARRPGLTEAVSDAIAATADIAAIRALLANQEAAIREATLDALIAGAAAQETWHAPLVRRPQLSEKAARALSDIVCGALLGELARRADLPEALAADLARRLAERQSAEHLPAEHLPAERQSAERPSTTHRGPFPRQSTAEALASAGGPTEQTLLAAVRRGDSALAAACLASAAGVPLAAVERAVRLRSAKGLVSLLWRAGFSMDAAAPVQALLAGLAPGEVLPPGPAGSFPLGTEEMGWHVDLLGHGGP
jgi:uncharacterized protein (DUF2336 family)